MWNNLRRDFWAVNFDLDTKLAKEFHPSHTHQGAYAELKRFFENAGFEHRQHSGYISKTKFTMLHMRFLAYKLNRSFPYAKEYINEMDATIIKPQYVFSFKEYFNKERLDETVKYTGEVENFIPQPKVQENREINQMQNEDVIPHEINGGVFERKVEIPIKPLENTTGENKTEVVKKHLK